MLSVKTLLNGIRTALDDLATKIKRVSTNCDALATVPLYEYPVGETIFETTITSFATKITTPVPIAEGETYYVAIGDLAFRLTAEWGQDDLYPDGALSLSVPGGFTLILDPNQDYTGALLLTTTTVGGFRDAIFKICRIDPPVKVGEMALHDYIDAQIKASVQDVVRNGDFQLKLTSPGGYQYWLKVNSSGEVEADKIEETAE